MRGALAVARRPVLERSRRRKNGPGARWPVRMRELRPGRACIGAGSGTVARNARREAERFPKIVLTFPDDGRPVAGVSGTSCGSQAALVCGLPGQTSFSTTKAAVSRAVRRRISTESGGPGREPQTTPCARGAVRRTDSYVTAGCTGSLSRDCRIRKKTFKHPRGGAVSQDHPDVARRRQGRHGRSRLSLTCSARVGGLGGHGTGQETGPRDSPCGAWRANFPKTALTLSCTVRAVAGDHRPVRRKRMRASLLQVDWSSRLS